MFLFIYDKLGNEVDHEYSNTSHVLIYQERATNEAICGYNSNTSHVLIYRHCILIWWLELQFKYISCSYLSQLTVQKKIFKDYSNTSHVLIYHIT